MNDDDLLEEEQEQEPVLVGDSLAYTLPYVCKQCGNQWEMNFYDIMRLTDKPTMECGCLWACLTVLPAQGFHQSDQ